MRDVRKKLRAKQTAIVAKLRSSSHAKNNFRLSPSANNTDELLESLVEVLNTEILRIVKTLVEENGATSERAEEVLDVVENPAIRFSVFIARSILNFCVLTEDMWNLAGRLSFTPHNPNAR